MNKHSSYRIRFLIEFIILCSILLALSSSLFAQAGQTGLAFLKLGVGSRALGMGDAYSAVAADPSAVHYNPAALSLSSTSQILLMHKEWIQDVKTEFLAAKTSFDEFTVAFGINSTSVNDIPIREVAGPQEGTFNSHWAAVGLSAAYQVNSDLSFGVTGNFLYEKIFVNEASGYGIDLGALYQTPWDIRLAVAVNNIGSMSALDQSSTKLPTTLRFGAAYQRPVEAVNGVLTTALDIISIAEDSKPRTHLGAELEFEHTFSLRAGYQLGYDAKNFSLGTGVRYGAFQIGYAFVPLQSDLGTTHTFSLGIEFPK